jgi:hypothetical protein
VCFWMEGYNYILLQYSTVQYSTVQYTHTLPIHIIPLRSRGGMARGFMLQHRIAPPPLRSEVRSGQPSTGQARYIGMYLYPGHTY